MKKLWMLLHKIAEYGTLLGFIGMILAVSIQVLARFLLPSAPSWTEEISRIFFIYTVSFGVSIGIRDGAFVRLELLQNYLSNKAKRRLEIIIDWGSILFSGSLLYHSYRFYLIGIHEYSPSLNISMSVAFASIFIMMFSIMVFALEHVLALKNQKI